MGISGVLPSTALKSQTTWRAQQESATSAAVCTFPERAATTVHHAEASERVAFATSSSAPETAVDCRKGVESSNIVEYSQLSSSIVEANVEAPGMAVGRSAAAASLGLQNSGELQDYLAALVLSECVYKKLEMSSSELADKISEYTNQFPSGWLKIDAVQVSTDSIEQHFLVATGGDSMYVAFMGTKQARDYVSDANVAPKPVWAESLALAKDRRSIPSAHTGFLKRAQSIDIVQLYDLAAENGKKLVLCGHSLGGAVAKLCTLQLLRELPQWSSPNVSCICFATPAIGNSALASHVVQAGWAPYFKTYFLPEDQLIRIVSFIQPKSISRSSSHDSMHSADSGSPLSSLSNAAKATVGRVEAVISHCCSLTRSPSASSLNSLGSGGIASLSEAEPSLPASDDDITAQFNCSMDMSPEDEDAVEAALDGILTSRPANSKDCDKANSFCPASGPGSLSFAAKAAAAQSFPAGPTMHPMPGLSRVVTNAALSPSSHQSPQIKKTPLGGLKLESHPLLRRRRLNLALALVLQRKKLFRRIRRLLRRLHMSLPRLPFELPAGSFHAFGTQMFLFSTTKVQDAGPPEGPSTPRVNMTSTSQPDEAAGSKPSDKAGRVPGGLFNYHRMISYRLRTMEIIAKHFPVTSKNGASRSCGEFALGPPVSVRPLVPTVTVTSAVARLPLDLMLDAAHSSDEASGSPAPAKRPRWNSKLEEEDTVTLDVQVEGINFHFNRVVSAKLEPGPSSPEASLDLQAHVADMTRIPARAIKEYGRGSLRSEKRNVCSLRPTSVLTRMTGYLSRHPRESESDTELKDPRDRCHMTVRLAVPRSCLANLVSSSASNHPGRHMRASRIRALPQPPPQKIVLRLSNDFGEVKTSVQLMPYCIAIWGTSPLASSLIHSALQGPASSPVARSANVAAVSKSQDGTDPGGTQSSPSASIPWWWPQPVRWATELSNCASEIREGLMSARSAKSMPPVDTADADVDISEGPDSADPGTDSETGLQLDRTSPAHSSLAIPSSTRSSSSIMIPFPGSNLLRLLGQAACSSLSSSPSQRASMAVRASPVDLVRDDAECCTNPETSDLETPLHLDGAAVGSTSISDTRSFCFRKLDSAWGADSLSDNVQQPGIDSDDAGDQEGEGSGGHKVETGLLDDNGQQSLEKSKCATELMFIPMSMLEAPGGCLSTTEEGEKSTSNKIQKKCRRLTGLFRNNNCHEKLSEDPYDHLSKYGWHPLPVRAYVLMLMRLLSRKRRSGLQAENARSMTPRTPFGRWKPLRPYRLHIARLRQLWSSKRRAGGSKDMGAPAVLCKRVIADTEEGGDAPVEACKCSKQKCAEETAGEDQVHSSGSKAADGSFAAELGANQQMRSSFSPLRLSFVGEGCRPSSCVPASADQSRTLETLEEEMPLLSSSQAISDALPAENTSACSSPLDEVTMAGSTSSMESTPLLSAVTKTATCSSQGLASEPGSAAGPSTWRAFRTYNFQLCRLRQIMLLRRWRRHPVSAAGSASCSAALGMSLHSESTPAYTRRTYYSILRPILQNMWLGSRGARSLVARPGAPALSDLASQESRYDRLGLVAAEAVTSRSSMSRASSLLRSHSHLGNAPAHPQLSHCVAGAASASANDGLRGSLQPCRRRLVRTFSAPASPTCFTLGAAEKEHADLMARWAAGVASSCGKDSKVLRSKDEGSAASQEHAVTQSIEGPVMFHDVMASAPMVSPYVLLRVLMAAIRQQGLNRPWWRQVVCGIAQLVRPVNSILRMYYFVRGLPLWWMKAVRHVVDLNLAQNWSALIVAVSVRDNTRALQGRDFAALVQHAAMANVALQPVLVTSAEFPSILLASKIDMLSRVCHVPPAAVSVLTMEDALLHQSRKSIHTGGIQAPELQELRDALHALLATRAVEI